eukprot:9616588-Alexandrium_andersonii.AAC.1
MAEGRWRWGTRGAISASVNMARRVLDFDLQGNRSDAPFPQRWREGVGMEVELDNLWDAGWRALHTVAGSAQQRDFLQRFTNHKLGDKLLRYRKPGDTSVL